MARKCGTLYDFIYLCMKKELVVFCVSKEAYFLPKRLAKLAKESDRLCEETNDKEAYNLAKRFIEEIRKKYEPISIYHLFTGDIS